MAPLLVAALLIVCCSNQLLASGNPSSSKLTNQTQATTTTTTTTTLANDTGGVDEILRDTFQLLDSLDQRLTQVANKTRGDAATLRALDDDFERDLAAQSPVVNSQQASPARDSSPKSALVVPNLFSKISGQQQLQLQQQQQTSRLRIEDDDQLTRLAERFSSVRKSAAEPHDGGQPLDSLATSASQKREHKVPLGAPLAASPTSSAPKKQGRQLSLGADEQAAGGSFGHHATTNLGKFDNNFTEKHIRFTLDLMQAVFASRAHASKLKEQALESFVISPVSIQLVLMMMHLGARGQTKRELSNSLHFLAGAPAASNSSTTSNDSSPSNGLARIAKLTRRHPQQQQQQRQASTAKPSPAAAAGQPATAASQQQTLNNNVHEQFGAAMRQLLKDSTVVRALTSANQIFYQRDLALSAQYEWAVRHYYGADLKQVDFQNQAEPPPPQQQQQPGRQSASNASATVGVQHMINEWVERQTRGKICNFLTAPVPTATLLMALNVLFYKGDWQYKFDPADTDPEAWFTRNDGQTVKVPMMVGKLPLAHAHDPAMRASVVELPYKAQRLGLFILLPDEPNGLAETMQLLNSSSFANLISMMRKAAPLGDPSAQSASGGGGGGGANADGINVRIPKFSIESSPRLSQILSQQLGLKTLFSPDLADLSGMFAAAQKRAPSQAPNQSAQADQQQQQQLQHAPLQVGLDELLHKAVLQVHEQGSIAAAASATIVERNGLFNGQYFEADHPFLVFLMDKQTGLVLFSGVYAGPAGGSPSATSGAGGPSGETSGAHHKQHQHQQPPSSAHSNSSSAPAAAAVAAGHPDAGHNVSLRSPKASA